ncbi:MAG: heparinase II/III family protein [Clostridia bacterium]|nr:heparinase II/III family protein [Clostridia bacterium]
MKFYKKTLFFAAAYLMLNICGVNAEMTSESVYLDNGTISAAEYDGENAMISGRVSVPNSSVTIEVLDEGAVFGNIVDNTSFNAAAEKLAYIKQVETDKNGRYSVSWRFSKTREGIYPVRVYSAAEDRTYTSNLKIGASSPKVDKISHSYENSNGETGTVSADTLVIETELSENSGKATAAAVIVAQYDEKSGNLLCADYMEQKIFGNAKTLITARTRLYSGAGYIKVFVWDNVNGMHPVGESVGFDVAVLVPPNGQDIYEDMLKHLGEENVHPRIVASESDFDNVLYKIQNNTVIKKEYEQFKKAVSYFEGSGDVSYDMVSGAILSNSRKFKDIMMMYGMMYKITGNTSWAEKMWRQIEIVSNDFPDWNPSHFLDTAELAYGYGLAYDWLYDWLSDEQKALMARTVNERAFKPIMDDYLENPDRKRTFYWSRPVNSNNWNLVCNGGVMCAALAFLDNESVGEAAKTILTCGMKNITNGIELYEKDGDWEEGITYWCYASSYLGKFMTSLENTAGTKYGFTSLGGIEKSFDFIRAMQGATQPFNFHDSEDSIVNQGTVYWFAHEYNNKQMLAYTRQEIMYKYSWSDIWELLWYDGSCEDTKIEFPSDYIGAKIGTVTMRSGSEKTDTYVGFHNGSNNVSHSQLDAGTFVIDSQGERFVKDLGKDSYDLTPRFGVYRNRAEGHNTLVINPSSKNDQNSLAQCGITGHGFSDTSFAIADLTDAYIDYANSVNRGIMLTDSRSVVIVKDELNLKNESDVYWFAHTDAEVSISDDKKTAVLELNGKYMQAGILGDGEFEIMEAKPFETSPVIEGQAENSGVKLSIHLTNYKSGTIEVGFAPINSPGERYSFTKTNALNEWR